MELKQLISNIKNQIVSANDLAALRTKSRLIDIKGLALNSKLVKPGDLFFCLLGTRYKGPEYISEAYANGARAIIANEKIPSFSQNILSIEVKDTVKCLGVIAEKFYGYPLKKVKSIAVTGTNGKTSVTFIIENILNSYKQKVGVIGTVNYRFGRSKIEPKNTTPDILSTYRLINRMLKQNTKHLLIEVSSHALDQRRLEGLKFDQAIFTNLSQDHFDYHKTKSSYFAAKSKLFTDYLRRGGTAIINNDDDYGKKIIGLAKRNKNCRVLTYGIKSKADIQTKDIDLRGGGSKFVICLKKKRFEIDTNLIGLFNVYNILAAVAACLKLGVPLEYIKRGLEEISIPGRMQLISGLRGVKIFVDYAHTDDALKKALYSLRGLRGYGRIILVFGCGGNRDRGKRCKMGRVASELADAIIVTSDNPRCEDPRRIISDIKKGIKNKRCLSFIDRRTAIEKAIAMSKSGDIILVAGKGHEDCQIIKDQRLPFNDCLVVKEILSKKTHV